MSTDSALTREAVIGDIAEILQIPEADVTDTTNVLDIGMDSVRLMSLIEKWRAAGAGSADLVVLASDPVVGSWLRELGVADTSATPASGTGTEANR